MINNINLIIIVFFGGVLSFFSPCIFPIIPIYFGILSEGGSKFLKVINTILFILGLGLTFVALGFSFSIIGNIFFNQYIKIIAGIIIIIFGINQLELFKIKSLQQTKTINIDINKFKFNRSIKAFILGLTFSLGWTPCVGPILATVLGYAGDNKPIFAILLMLMYVLGLAIPFVIFSILSDELLIKARGLNKYLPILKKISGILIMVMGILLLLDKLTIFT